jgi:glutaredoxin
MSLFSLPSTNSYTIYSISDCPYCDKVKELLKDKKPEPVIINCDQFKQNSREEFLTFMKEITNQDWKTFPMVFHNGKFIGGYSDTENYFDNLIETEDF